MLYIPCGSVWKRVNKFIGSTFLSEVGIIPTGFIWSNYKESLSILKPLSAYFFFTLQIHVVSI